ncbi:MAG: ThiF family adenylyltransferase [Dehalococcoidia bacterium]
MQYTLRWIKRDASIMVVGCGGTGGYVAEGLCRLIKGTEYRLELVDHDRVEERNLVRQNFFKSDLGRFKAEVLAKRLAAQYSIPVDYCISPIQMLDLNYRGHLTIGCVDNARARERMQYAGRYTMGGMFGLQKFGGWWIDAGNGENSGQVLIGNALLKESGQSFYPESGVCRKLPVPTVQQPGLLAPAPKKRLSCAQDVEADGQSPVINRMMADLVLTFVHKLMKGTLSWMAAYVDLEAGTMSSVDATPEAVSRITGHTVRQLEYIDRGKRR